MREARETPHGWLLLLGWPWGIPRGRGGSGGPRIILTRPLVDHLEAHRRDPGSVDLPCGRTAIKRLRALLGLNWYVDGEAWWMDRLEDLATLSGVEFAQRHGVSSAAVSYAHTACFGPRGWVFNPRRPHLLSCKLCAWEDTRI